MLKSLAEHFRHTELRFNPTGDITLETMTDWLNYGAVKAVGGSRLARSQGISAGNWEAIKGRAKAARAVAQEVVASSRARATKEAVL